MGIINSLLGRAHRRKIYADLINLDDHLLRDIGLTRGDVNRIVAGRAKTTRAYD